MRSGWFKFMTEDEFRILEHRMAINRAEQILHCGCPEPVAHLPTCPRLIGTASDPVEWPEHMIEQECTRLLEQDGWRALRTDPVSDRGRGKGFGELGMADHLYFRYAYRKEDPWNVDDEPEQEAFGRCHCQILWIEFKSAKGKPSKDQITWHTIERARGALTWIAGVDFPASVAGFVEHYRKSGLNRGRI